MTLRLTFDEDSWLTNKLEFTGANLPHGSAHPYSLIQTTIKQVFIYTTNMLHLDEAIENRLLVGLSSAGFQVTILNSLSNIASELLTGKPAGVIIDIDRFEEIQLIGSLLNTSVWNSIVQATTVVIASTRAGNPTFRSSWESLAQIYVQSNPPDIVETIALFNRTKASEFIPFELNITLSEVRVRPGFDSFVDFSITASKSTGYVVNLRTEGVPLLSSSEPIPRSGTPPFTGVLKTNIGIVTVGGRHPISLIGEGGGLTKSDVITYITN